MSIEMKIYYIGLDKYQSATVDTSNESNALTLKKFSVNNIPYTEKYIHIMISLTNNDLGNMVTPGIYYTLPSTNLTLLNNYTEITLSQSETDIVAKLNESKMKLVITKQKDNEDFIQVIVSSSLKSLGIEIEPNTTTHLFGYIKLFLDNSENDLFKGSFDISVEEM